jgi:PhnB protein
MMRVEPYLDFEGRCEEALEFYKKAVGAKVDMMMKFGEAPDQSMITPGSEKKVMHASVKIGDSVVMCSDGFNKGKTNFEGISLSLTVGSDAEAKKSFDALSQGGKVTLPLTKTFFASSFGMVADKFGVHWMIMMPASAPA